MKNIIKAAAAAAVAIGLVVGGVSLSASAHDLRISGVASCQTDGTYTVTWTYGWANVPGDAEAESKVITHTPAGSLLNGVDGQLQLSLWSQHKANGPAPVEKGSWSTTFTQSNIPGSAHTAEVVVQTDWTDGFNSSDDNGSVTLTGNCAVTPPPPTGPTVIPVPTLTVTPPTCDTDGTLPFLGNPAAQNPNGYEFPGQGYRVYISPAFAGPGTYTATIQKVGPGFDPAFPNGTKLSGGASTTQTLVVLPKTGYQNTDSTAVCYSAPVPPKVTSTEWVDGTYKCDDTTVEQTRTTTTTPYVFDATTGTYNPDKSSATTVTDSRVRDLTAAEITACPVVTPPDQPQPPTKVVETLPTPKADGLAYTGVNGGTLVGATIGGFLLLTAGVTLVFFRRQKKSAE